METQLHSSVYKTAFTRLFAAYMRDKTFDPITHVRFLCQKSVPLTTYVSPRPARNSLSQFLSSVNGRYLYYVVVIENAM